MSLRDSITFRCGDAMTSKTKEEIQLEFEHLETTSHYAMGMQ